MSLRRLFSADAGLSLLLHALKALVALFVNWLVLRHFAVSDFVVWSVTSSILIVATASDLGIGQYTVTQLVSAKRSEWSRYVSESLGALLPLALGAGVFVFLAVEGPPVSYKVTMAVLLATRIAVIPFAVVLNAANQFKIRKAFELGAYIAASIGIAAVIWTGSDVRLALIVLNASFLASTLMAVVFATRYISLRESLRITGLTHTARIFRTALPFTVSNLSGLLTYGGFIFLSSIVLPHEEVAKLAVLHSFVLVNLYQMYDVFLKARQADLADPVRLAPYRRLNLILMLALPPLFLLAGRQALSLIGSPVEIGFVVTAMFGLFIAFEMGNLFVQSITQVNLPLVHRLIVYASIRSAALVSFALVGVLPVADAVRLPLLLGCLTLGSMTAFVYLLRGVQLRDVEA